MKWQQQRSRRKDPLTFGMRWVQPLVPVLALKLGIVLSLLLWIGLRDWLFFFLLLLIPEIRPGEKKHTETRWESEMGSTNKTPKHRKTSERKQKASQAISTAHVVPRASVWAGDDATRKRTSLSSRWMPLPWALHIQSREYSCLGRTFCGAYPTSVSHLANVLRDVSPCCKHSWLHWEADHMVWTSFYGGTQF